MVASDDRLLRLIPVIRKVAKGYATDEDHADDLIHECLVHVAVKLSKYRATGSMKAWASKVADNRCKSLARADHAEPCDRDDEYHDVQEIPDPDPLPDERLEQVSRSAALRAAVKRLPQRERTAVELVYLEGLLHSEAADRMDVGVKAVRALVSRGVHTLKGNRELAVWRESPGEKTMTGTGRTGVDVDDGRHPVLALQPETEARERVRAGVCFGEIDRLLDGVCFAAGWRHLRTLADRLPGCPVIVDPGCPSARRSGVEQLRRFRAGLPACPIIGYGDPRGSWCRKSVRDEIGFVATLQRGVNDGPDAVRMALLRAADCDETERLLDRMRDRLPNAMHGLLDAVMHESLTRCSVAELAATMGLAPRTLQRRCRAHRLPSPKRLLALALVFHVERLACWSGHRRGPTALALGFSDATDYTHLVKRTLGITPTEVARRGGPAHVAHVMLENLR